MCVSVVQWTTVSGREAQNPISNSVHKVVRHSCTVQSPHWMERLGGDYFLPPRIVWYIWYIYVHVPPGIVWHNVPPRIVWCSVTERYRETLLILYTEWRYNRVYYSMFYIVVHLQRHKD